MTRTFIRQDAQISASNATPTGYVDNTAPAAAMESGATNILDDLNNLRSIVNLHLRADQTLNWYDDLTAPSTLEAGTKRGINEINDGLHLVEVKRVLRNVFSLIDVTVGAGNNYVILSGAQLPASTTIAVGSVTTLGTVAAAHGGTFGTHSLAEVSGPNAINPKNLMLIVDGSTRDPILSSGRTVYGLLQSENASDGHTATGTTPNRLQISFVRINGTGDDLEAVPTVDIENAVINYATRERVRLEDLTEADFTSGAVVDVPAGATVTRQVAYDNQGTTPVDVTTNSILDLEGAGIEWTIRDDLEANLFRIVEGSAGGTSTVQLGGDVDSFDNNAVVNDFAAGVTVRSGGTRPIQVGVTDGVIETTAGDLKLDGFALLAFEDSNKAGSTYATDLVLSDTSAEWDNFETAFGEVSLLNAIYQAATSNVRSKVQAVVTTTIAADTDVNGPTYAANVDTDLPPYDAVNFVTDVDVFVNGLLQRNGANAAANEDVYPGTVPAQGDLKFEYVLKAGGTPDVITVIVNGQ